MKPIIPWVGGKRRLLKHILALIPDHRCYVEVFAGSAAVLFAKEPAKAEVVNDRQGELVNFYRVVRYHWGEFLRELQYNLVSREEFERDRTVDPSHLTDIQRAARFYRLLKTSFGSKLVSPSFGYSTSTPPRLNPDTVHGHVEAAHSRLSRVTIECLDWSDCTQRYDRPGTFFYMDPPYWRTQGYGERFDFPEYERIAETMGTMKGKALLSIGQEQKVLDLFKGPPFKRKKLSIQYSVGGGHKRAARDEYLIRNYA